MGESERKRLLENHCSFATTRFSTSLLRHYNKNGVAIELLCPNKKRPYKRPMYIITVHSISPCCCSMERHLSSKPLIFPFSSLTWHLLQISFVSKNAGPMQIKLLLHLMMKQAVRFNAHFQYNSLAIQRKKIEADDSYSICEFFSTPRDSPLTTNESQPFKS